MDLDMRIKKIMDAKDVPEMHRRVNKHLINLQEESEVNLRKYFYRHYEKVEMIELDPEYYPIYIEETRDNMGKTFKRTYEYLKRNI